MRLSLIALLLVGAAAPALAQPEPEDRVERRSDERSERRVQREVRFERPERAERAERAERPERAERAEPRFERPEPRVEQRQAEAPAPAPREERAARAERPAAQDRRETWSRRPDTGEAPDARPADGVAGWRWRERNAERRSRNRNVPPTPASPVFGEQVATPQTVTRPGAVLPSTRAIGDRRMGDVLRDRVAAEGWRKQWRNDRRYDWRRHRDRDRNRFHVGIYIDPFGWGYRDWQLGWRLPSRFYASHYWIDDPWAYRLPEAYGPYRWIRYYDDVLLVDMRTGRVVDRIRNFFW